LTLSATTGEGFRRFVNSIILDLKYANYEKKILTTLSSKMVGAYLKKQEAHETFLRHW
jgi:hypothetical protein